MMKSIQIGTMRKQPAGFQAFIPAPFPPEGGYNFDSKLLKKDNEATRLLGKLDGITQKVEQYLSQPFLVSANVFGQA